METRRFLSCHEFAKHAGISAKTVWRWLQAGKLPAIQPGGPGTAWIIDYQAFVEAICWASRHDKAPATCGQNQATAALPCEVGHSIEAAAIPGPRPRWTQSSF